MSKAIGLRLYKVVISEKRKIGDLDHFDPRLNVTLEDFIPAFIGNHATINQHDNEQRSWYFEERAKDTEGQSAGLIHYGTFGFESNLIDSKTKAKLYRRKVTDIEEVPLFYQIWAPSDCKYGLISFQSFQGRSAISLIYKKMKDEFEKLNPGFGFYFRKIMPNDMKGTYYHSAPVKKFRLIKRKVSSDLADRYFDNPSPDPINFEIVVSARRNRTLGDLGSLLGSLKTSGKSVVTHDGIEFPEAIAEVSIGGKNRRVGVLGLNQDAGVIDLTDAVDWGSDGHPTFDSLYGESDTLLDDIHDVLCD